MADRPPQARPLVIIPARFSSNASALRYQAEVSAVALIQAVYDAGGEPLVVHPEAPGAVFDDALVQQARERLWMADAVLLPGGGDLAPHWSGQQPHSTLYDVDETQDAFDLAVATMALQDHLPLLAICRGNQVVNVARGGDLVQDMAETSGEDHRNLVHDITLDADSPLNVIAPSGSATISCYHHQCLGVLGKDLIPAAHAADGTIEAVTLAGHRGWYLGVQWHPEDSASTNPVQAQIFRSFVTAALGATGPTAT